MKYIREFKNISKKDVEIAGGKGASLGEMTQAGIPVPNGFVILSESFEEFVEENKLNVEIDAALDKVNPEDINSVEEASTKIQGAILSFEVPKQIEEKINKEFKALKSKFVAVRSSATSEDSADAAWAGQLDSFLNTTEETLIENVKRCWASLFTPRAIFYRFEKKLHKEKVSVAVVVQKMVNSEESGIAFSVHPVTEDENQLIIEAGLGLGEAIVSGQITPDAYVYDKAEDYIIDISVSEQEKGLYRKSGGGNEWKELGEKGTKQTLNGKEITELSKMIIHIEKHYGFPVDVEWAREDAKFYIVQSRPITTLAPKVSEKVKKKHSLKKVKKEKGFNPNDYARMFAGKSYSFILTDIFLGYYNYLGALSIQDEGAWTSFISKECQKKSLIEGKKLYESKSNYKNYCEGFKEYVESSSKYFEFILSKKFISALEVKKFFKLASKYFVYYAKTEFFYTDSIDQKKMAISVKEFDKLKLMGRAYLNKILFEGKGYLKGLIRKISEQTNVKEQDLLNYGIEEIINLVKNNKEVEKSILKSRDTFFASKNLVLFGKKSRPLVNEFLSPYREISKTIKGTIANKGQAKGNARVLFPDFNDFDKIAKEVNNMKKGEILIAETTSPEIIKACKKAGAIVTNQGGMLSHAAIISRELGIPCVIGTDKDILLNIKTGDLVEVDADKGIVRVLKRA